MSSSEISAVMAIIANDGMTAYYISDTSAKYLNYILPVSWYAAEVPMNGVKAGPTTLLRGIMTVALY